MRPRPLTSIEDVRLSNGVASNYKLVQASPQLLPRAEGWDQATIHTLLPRCQGQYLLSEHVNDCNSSGAENRIPSISFALRNIRSVIQAEKVPAKRRIEKSGFDLSAAL
jgi:hypothetical protein